jgi:hypothetical protein
LAIREPLRESDEAVCLSRRHVRPEGDEREQLAEPLGLALLVRLLGCRQRMFEHPFRWWSFLVVVEEETICPEARTAFEPLNDALRGDPIGSLNTLLLASREPALGKV